MPDDEVVDIDRLLEIHTLISKVVAYNGRLDERVKSLEMWKFWIMGLVAATAVCSVGVAVKLLIKGVL